MKTTLIAVATPGYYHDAAMRMFETARLKFKPTEKAQLLCLPGIEGKWPTGTITRAKVMLDNWNRVEGDYVYAIDADMIVEGFVGPEILGELVATEHPGYVGRHCTCVPYERNERSASYVRMGEGDRYFCGGFYGGENAAVRDHLFAVESLLAEDDARGLVPVWHDESAANRAWCDSPPTVILSPAYTHPDRDQYYRECVWKQDYPRLIVALDKSEAERGDRAA